MCIIILNCYSRKQSVDVATTEFLFFLFHTSLYHIAITTSPQSVNTALNEVAVFNCTYVGDAVVWEANGRRIFSGQNGYKITDVPLSSISAMSMLTVVTSLDKNNTNITCTALTLDLSTAEGEPALLLLQGKSF